MNNWDKRPSIEVVTTNVALPYLTNIVTDMMLDDVIEDRPTLYQIEEGYYMVTKSDKDIDYHTIQNALRCLKDHMENLSIGEWAKVNGDLLVSKVDDLWVTEWMGTYHGPKIDIQVTYYEA